MKLFNCDTATSNTIWTIVCGQIDGRTLFHKWDMGDSEEPWQGEVVSFLNLHPPTLFVALCETFLKYDIVNAKIV